MMKKKWWIAVPAAGVLTLGAFGVYGMGLFSAAPAVPAAGQGSVVEQLRPVAVAEAAAEVAAPEKSYVTYQEVKAKAFEQSGFKEKDITNYEIKFDSRGFMPIYQVEVETNAGGVDLQYDARTGELLGTQESTWRHTRTKKLIRDNKVIGDDKAMALALKDAGVTQESLDRYELKLRTKNNEMTYEVELHIGQQEYEYDIRASDGVILKKEYDMD